MKTEMKLVKVEKRAKKFDETDVKAVKEYFSYYLDEYTEAEIEKKIRDYMEKWPDYSIWNVVMDLERYDINTNLKYWEEYYDYLDKEFQPTLDKYNIKEDFITVEELQEVPVYDDDDLDWMPVGKLQEVSEYDDDDLDLITVEELKEVPVYDDDDDTPF